MIRSLGRRCRGDLWSPAQWRPGLPAGACAAGAPISSRRNGGKEGPGGSAHPGSPNTGVHGGGKLYRQSKNRACIHARFLFGFVTGAAAPWAARIDHPASPDNCRAVPTWPAGPPSVPASEGPGCPSQPAGNCPLCRGGYHPPACPRSRWPRGARQGELPQRGKRRCPGVQPGPPPVCPRNHWPRGARQGELPQRGKRRCPGVRPGALFVYRGAPWRRPTGFPALRGSPRAPSRTAPGSSPPQCTAAY